MNQYGFYINVDSCIGCKVCGMACMEKNDLTPGEKFRRILLSSVGKWEEDENGVFAPKDVFSYGISMACNHCSNPACVGACPSGAMTKDDETGIVSSDPETCIGCGSCTKACPYEVPFVDRETNVSRKCDFCKDELDAGRPPACVGSCSMNALEFGELDKLRSKHPDAVQQLDPLPSANTTDPSILISPPANYKEGMDLIVFNLPEEIEVATS